MSEHAKSLQPGEIRTHTVGDQTFKIMHTGNGAYTQATVRTAGVLTTEVLATLPFESAALKIYATAIERAEAAAAPVGLADVPQDRSADGVPEVAQQRCGGLPLPVGDMVPRCGTFAAHHPHPMGTSIRYRTLDEQMGANTPAEARTGTSDRVAAALNELAMLGVLLESWSDDGWRITARGRLDAAMQLLRAEVGTGA